MRRFFPLFVLLAFSLILMTYQSNKGALVPLSFLSTPLNHLNGLFHSLSASVKEPFRKMFLRDEENKQLKEEISRLLLEQQKYRELLLENERFRGILELKENEKRYVTTARIISKGLDQWSHTVVIGKGRNAGIAKDMAVMTPRGLVGKVSGVTDNFASVLLMTDISFSAAVKLQETRREAILSGTGTARCILKYVPEEDTIQEGEVVVTSGYDELFPRELLVGKVSRVLKKGTTIFQLVEVKPAENLTKLDEVIVVKK